MKQSIKSIITNLQDPVYRLDGLIGLKKLQVTNYKDILNYIDHPFWLAGPLDKLEILTTKKLLKIFLSMLCTLMLKFVQKQKKLLLS